MSSTIQSYNLADFIHTVQLESFEMEETLLDTLSVPPEESHMIQYSHRLSDNKAEADKVLLGMLKNDVPRTVIRSILQSDSYDIRVPPNPSTAPYLVISYADDTEEEYYASINNVHPTQDWTFLMVPRPGMTAADRNQDDDEEEEWDPVTEESEAHSYSLVDFEELSTLGLPAEIEDYFSGRDRQRRITNLLAGGSVSAQTGFIPIGFEINGVFNKIQPRTEDWSDEYDLGDDELDIDEETDSSLELYGNDTESDLTEFSDSE
ncbi:unnamed protein product [Rhizoctonia solani]|uniref:Uncharacterized protein n=2 Tax=Rhizoctonia solani TaxID=456999 RepID=A0A8H3HIP3_9AGAM